MNPGVFDPRNFDWTELHGQNPQPGWVGAVGEPSGSVL